MSTISILLAQKTPFISNSQTQKQVKPPMTTLQDIKNVIQNNDMMDRFSRYATNLDFPEKYCKEALNGRGFEAKTKQKSSKSLNIRTCNDRKS